VRTAKLEGGLPYTGGQRRDGTSIYLYQLFFVSDPQAIPIYQLTYLNFLLLISESIKEEDL